MTVLVFKKGDTSVVTAAWTVASSRKDIVTVCYTWKAESIGREPSIDGVATAHFGIDIERFLALAAEACASGKVLDLKSYVVL